VPLEETCDGLDNDCNDEVDNDGCAEGCVGFVVADKSYVYCAALVSGGQAPTRCSEQSLAPLRIDSEDENAALLEAVRELDDALGEDGPSQRGFWLGASDADEEGTWLWLEGADVFWIGEGDGAPVDDAYANWAEDRPNDTSQMGEDCAISFLEDGNDGDAGQWNDVLCGDEYPLVCEGLPVP
jgi:hypothetical protein